MIRTLSPLTAAAALVATAAAVPSSAVPARPHRPTISLSATPAHLTLLGRTAQSLVLRNTGLRRVRVVVTRVSVALDLYGNAAIAGSSRPHRSARAWLAVRPRRLVLAPRTRRLLRISARPPRGATAGDHQALVLLSAHALGHAHVAVRTRLGVLVFVRVPGRAVRRVAVGRVWVSRRARRRTIVVTTINRGNLVERLASGQVTVALWRGSRLVKVLRCRARDLLPNARGLVLYPVPRALHGEFVAEIHVAAEPARATPPTAPPLPGARRAFTLRL